MKRGLLYTSLALVVILLSGCFLLQSYNLTGTWLLTMYYKNQILSGPITITITQNGNSLSIYEPAESVTLNGTINGNNVQFSYMDVDVTISFTGTVSDSFHMSGTWTVTSSGQSESGTWNAVKQ